LNGELFVASGFGALEVLLRAVSLELVIAAATLVVVKPVVLDDPADPEVEEELESSPEAVVVSVKVDFSVVVLPLESVVMYVLIAPGCVVVLVYVEPSLFVPTITTGMTPVKPPFVELPVVIDVRVEVGPVTVVVLPIVTGYI